MKHNKTFVLVGFKHRENDNHEPLLRVLRERGFNIVIHTPESDGRNVRFLSYNNNRPTVIIDVMNDEERNVYFDIPAIHMSDCSIVTFRDGDYELGSSYSLADFDEIIYGEADDEDEVETASYDEDEDDDDYAPVVFSSNGCGYFGYNEAFDML